ncbi:MAG: YggS family pyridoxal phosphate-dependent enzyme [Clostridia bacterium]|nr:YggS family pyridoxal phosphate-dependent enzyme [Clostridia bacterium]
MVEENLKKVLNLISAGNNLGEKITLVGATKTMPVETINLAVKNGLEVVAENRVQEFREKHEFISPVARQHFIGRLQTNKVKYLVGKVELIHSVDSLHLAEAINKEAEKKSLIQNVLIEINAGVEDSKGGFAFETAKDSVTEIYNKCKNLKLQGLMTMLPHSEDQNFLAELCNKMRCIYDQLKKGGLPFEYLSMGMSNDYQTAIKNGSNLIRLGRTIFGQRNYGENANGNI